MNVETNAWLLVEDHFSNVDDDLEFGIMNIKFEISLKLPGLLVGITLTFFAI